MRAFVTGGGRGIGAGIAHALAGDGWDVVVGARTRDQVETVAQEIGGEWADVVQDGEAEGLLFGGCLALTTSLAGTPYDFWIEDGIWFWEDVDEPVYRIDRMLTHLRLSGRMKKIRGVIIGALKNCGNEAEMLILLREFFRSFDIPVVQNLPFGHHGNNLLMPIGTRARLATGDCTLTVMEPAVGAIGS